jgi:FkbM family methyltransferase
MAGTQKVTPDRKALPNMAPNRTRHGRAPWPRRRLSSSSTARPRQPAVPVSCTLEGQATRSMYFEIITTRHLRIPMNLLKKLASRLPSSWQHELKRLHFRRQIRLQTFQTTEPEFLILHQLVSAGDWVIDIGANVGQYTGKLSDLVGPQGRVIAVEPVPETFALLAANVLLFRYCNVTLLNLAASDRAAVVGIRIPDFDTGLKNYYQAAVTTQESEIQVMTASVDSLALSHRIRLIKIDAEGHDAVVLQGMERLLARDHPTLIVETTTPAALTTLANLGYRIERLPESSNTVFRWLPVSTEHPIR